MANMTTTTGTKFIPEIWSDEVVATYKSNLVMANLVNNLNHAGKKGDSIHIPQPGRSTASQKRADTNVTAITDTANDILVSIDKHYEWSMYIEDIASLQALSSMRKFYTDDAGFALAKQVDTDIITDLRGASAVTTATVDATALVAGTTYTIVSVGDSDFTLSGATNNAVGENFVATGTTTGTGTASVVGTGASDLVGIADANWDTNILAGIESLNDNDTPMNNRSLVCSPSAYTALLATDRFTEQAFIGNGNAISTGKVGSIYGVDVYVSSNIGTGATAKAIMFQKDALVLATQQSVRTQTQYKQEALADLFTADTVYGTKVVRAGSIVQMTGE
jgi:N4-gp56 family major capsid protein